MPFFKKNQIIFFILLIIIPLFIGTQQLGYDRDYTQYFHIFTQDANYLFTDSRFEKGFIVTIWLLQLLHTPTHLYYIIYAYISIVPKLILIKKYSHGKYTPYLYYFSPFIFLHDDTQIRLAVSLALLAWGIHFFYRKNYAYFGVLGLLSCTFHYQSIIVIFTLPLISYLSRTKINIKLLFKFSTTTLLLYLTIANIQHIINFTSQYIPTIESYSEATDKPNIFNIMIILNTLLSLWGFKIFTCKKNPLEKKYWLLGFFGVISYYLLAQVGNIAFRISEAFLFFNCFWIGYSIKNRAYYLHRYVGYTIIFSLFSLNIYNITYNDKPFYFSMPLDLYE